MKKDPAEILFFPVRPPAKRSPATVALAGLMVLCRVAVYLLAGAEVARLLHL